MSEILIMFALLVGVTVLPVMMSARLIGAGKTGFGASLLAVFLQTCLSIGTQFFVSSQLLAVAIAVFGSSAIYSLALDTTMLRGFVVSILSIVISIFVIVLFAGSFAILGSAT